MRPVVAEHHLTGILTNVFRGPLTGRDLWIEHGCRPITVASAVAAARNEASEAHRKFSLELIYIPSRIRNPAASVSREFFSRIFQYPLANNGRCCSWRHQKLCQPRHLTPGLRAQMRKEYFLLSNISLRNSTTIIVHLVNVSQWSLSDFVVEAYEDN